MRTNRIAAIAMGLAMACLAAGPLRVEAQAYRLNAGTTMDVRLDSKISTDEVSAGDTWTGTVTRNIYSNRGALVIPAGSQVEGQVTSVVQGDHNTRPSLDLAVRRVDVNGYSRPVTATTPTIIAGSKRAKKLGAIALGAAGGAAIGGVTSGKKGAIIGGLLGGAASYGLTRHAFRTMQLKEGSVISFTVDQTVAMRR